VIVLHRAPTFYAASTDLTARLGLTCFSCFLLRGRTTFRGFFWALSSLSRGGVGGGCCAVCRLGRRWLNRARAVRRQWFMDSHLLRVSFSPTGLPAFFVLCTAAISRLPHITFHLSCGFLSATVQHSTSLATTDAD